MTQSEEAPAEVPSVLAAAAGETPPQPGLVARFLRHPGLRVGVSLALSLAVLGWMYGPALVAHVRHSADPLTFNDDVRVQIYPFEHYKDPALFPNDYLGQYTLAAMAWGYRLLFQCVAVLWDAKLFSKVLPYLLLAVVAGALAKGAARWGKASAAFFAVGLVLSSDAFLERMGGGLPRGFGFAIAACGAAALVRGRLVVLAAVTCIGAAFYPAAAMPGGMALAVVALIYRAKDRGDVADWSLRRRFALVAGTACLAVVVLMPTALSLRKYGPYILEKDIAAYPEAGPGGRFYAGDRPPYPGLVDDFKLEARRALLGGGQKWASVVPGPGRTAGFSRTREKAVWYLVGFAALGFLRLVFKDEGARRLLAYLAAAAIGHVVAARVAPWLYLPQRYAVFPVPVLLCLLLPGAASALPGLIGRRGERAWLKAGSVLLVAALSFYLVGGRGSERVGLTVKLDPRTKLYPFLATLPKDVLIAGWPQTMDNVPYVSGRQALVTMECHVAFNAGYVEELRKRTRILIDAYLAPDRGPILRLRDELHVTHLLVDTRHFAYSPSYFRPFERQVRDAWARGKRDGFELPRLLKDGAIFTEGSFVVLDLARVSAAVTEAQTVPPSPP